MSEWEFSVPHSLTLDTVRLHVKVNGHAFVSKEAIVKQARSSKSLVLEILPKDAFERVAADARDQRLVQTDLFRLQSCCRLPSASAEQRLFVCCLLELLLATSHH